MRICRSLRTSPASNIPARLQVKRSADTSLLARRSSFASRQSASLVPGSHSQKFMTSSSIGAALPLLAAFPALTPRCSLGPTMYRKLCFVFVGPVDFLIMATLPTSPVREYCCFISGRGCGWWVYPSSLSVSLSPALCVCIFQGDRLK